MNRRICLSGLSLLLAATLAGGCRSPRAVDGGQAGKPLVKKVAQEDSKPAQAHAHYATAILHELNGETEQALAAYRRALDEDPANENLVLEVSHRFMLHKQPDKALQILQTATARKSASGEVYARLGSVYLLQGRGEDALAANRIAVRKSPLFLPAYQNLLMNLLHAKRSAEALQLLDTAAELPNADAGFLIGLSDLYHNYALQHPTQREVTDARAKAVLLRAKALNPGDPDDRLRLADGLYRVGENEAASQVYVPLLTQVSDLPLIRDGVRSKLVEIYLRADDRARAREQLESVLGDDPSNPQAYYLLGSIAYEEKRWPEAADNFRKVLLFAPNLEQAYYDLAAAQLASDDAPGALGTLRRMEGRFVVTFLRAYLSALAEARAKNFTEAARHFTHAEILARAGDGSRLTADFYFEAGVATERKGDREEAARYFEKALDLRGDFPEAQNYLGYMWAEDGKNLERAKDLIAKALAAEPKSAAYLDSMAWVLFKMNQPQSALEYQMRALENSEQPDATLFDHLGDIYSALDEKPKAEDAWRKSLAVEDNPVIRKKLPESGTR